MRLNCMALACRSRPMAGNNGPAPDSMKGSMNWAAPTAIMTVRRETTGRSTLQEAFGCSVLMRTLYVPFERGSIVQIERLINLSNAASHPCSAQSKTPRPHTPFSMKHTTNGKCANFRVPVMLKPCRSYQRTSFLFSYMAPMLIVPPPARRTSSTA